MTSQPSIAIIGAGIGGLAVSACLRKAGVETTIYEQAPAFTRMGAGIQMSPNAMRVLYGIGVGEQIRASAFEPPHWRNRDHDTGRLTNDHPLGPDALERYGVPYMLMHRGDLHAALHGAVANETIRYAHKLCGIDQSEAGVTLEFENGETVIYDAVIASGRGAFAGAGLDAGRGRSPFYRPTCLSHGVSVEADERLRADG